MNNQNMFIIMIIVFFILGCKISCSGLKENFTETDECKKCHKDYLKSKNINSQYVCNDSVLYHSSNNCKSKCGEKVNNYVKNWSEDRNNVNKTVSKYREQVKKLKDDNQYICNIVKNLTVEKKKLTYAQNKACELCKSRGGMDCKCLCRPTECFENYKI